MEKQIAEDEAYSRNTSSMFHNIILQFFCKELISNTNDFKTKHGEEGFGKVYAGKLKLGRNCIHGRVAVKRWNPKKVVQVDE